MNVLFVNKDSKTVQKRRSEQEARAINEHVNGTYARWQREQISKTNRGRVLPVDPIDTPTNSERHSSDSPESRPRHNTPLISSPATKKPTPSGLTSDDLEAIKFATEFHVNTLGVSEIPGVPANKLWYKWWLDARQEIHRPETQLALLAWAYSSMTFVHSSSPRDRVVKALEFRGAALQQVQRLMQSLKSQGDYATALDCTLYLGCVEWQSGLLHETTAHFTAAKSFLDLLGGIKVLPPQSQETVLWIFNSFSFTFSVRPLIHVKDISRSRHSRDNDGCNSLSRLSLEDGQSSDTVVGQLIGDRLAALLAETVEMIQGHEVLSKMPIATTEKIKRFHELYMCKLALQLNTAHLWHDMMEGYPSFTRRHGSSHGSSPASSLRSTFCLLLRLFQKISMDTFTSMIPWRKYWASWHDRVLDQLRSLQHEMRSSPTDRERPDRERKAKELIFLWLFFVGACVEQMFLTAGARDVENSGRIIFCSSQFTSLACKMGYQRAGDVAADFQKYIAFCVIKNGQILKKLMQPLEHGVRRG